jgi:Uma2 family endonuclease
MMVALPKEAMRMTEAEYLAFERASETKHEYIDGHVYAMAGASRTHNLICTNTVAALHPQLRQTPCEIYQGDMRVKVQFGDLYSYPDVTIVCDEPQFADSKQDMLLNPVILVEVLSPTTANYDRGRKFQQYRQLESIQEYLLIEQDSPRIERYLRQADNTWLLSDAIGLDASLELPSIGCTLKLADVYQKVTFETEDAAGQ